MDRVGTARDLKELARLGAVEVDPLVALMAGGLPELHHLEIAVRTRAAQIVAGHLRRLETLLETQGTVAFESHLGHLRREHWGYLHGSRAPLRDAVEHHVERIKHRARTR